MPDTTAPPADLQRVEVHAADTPLSGLATLAVGIVIVAALYLGRDVLVPMALAILLSFVLGPPVLLLRRWHINRVVAVITVVVLAFTVIVGIGALIGSQVAQLAENLPEYQSNITEKIRSLRDTTTSGGAVGRVVKALSDIGNEITKPSKTSDGSAAPAPAVVTPPRERLRRGAATQPESPGTKSPAGKDGFG